MFVNPECCSFMTRPNGSISQELLAANSTGDRLADIEKARVFRGIPNTMPVQTTALIQP